MLQFLTDIIDQLDLALDQLAINDRNFDRFALMLVDNVMELTLHSFIKDKARENDMWRRFDKPPFDPKLIERGMGQAFDGKVKAARQLGLIDITECETTLFLHSYRNTAYHKGLRHDSILHSLAILYFRTVCAVLDRYDPGSWSWGSNERYSYRAMKYLGDPRKHDGGDYRTLFRGVFRRLDKIAASFPDRCVEDLADDLQQTIDTIDQMLDFLGSGGPAASSRDDVVVDCQAWPFIFTPEAKAFAAEKGYCGNGGPDFASWIGANYPWQVRKDPIPGWLVRQESLRDERDAQKALKKYCEFMRQTEDLRARINNAAELLDSHIQQQIDQARGK